MEEYLLCSYDHHLLRGRKGCLVLKRRTVLRLNSISKQARRHGKVFLLGAADFNAVLRVFSHSNLSPEDIDVVVDCSQAGSQEQRQFFLKLYHNDECLLETNLDSRESAAQLGLDGLLYPTTNGQQTTSPEMLQPARLTWKRDYFVVQDECGRAYYPSVSGESKAHFWSNSLHENLDLQVHIISTKATIRKSTINLVSAIIELMREAIRCFDAMNKSRIHSERLHLFFWLHSTYSRIMSDSEDKENLPLWRFLAYFSEIYQKCDQEGHSVLQQQPATLFDQKQLKKQLAALSKILTSDEQVTKRMEEIENQHLQLATSRMSKWEAAKDSWRSKMLHWRLRDNCFDLKVKLLNTIEEHWLTEYCVFDVQRLDVVWRSKEQMVAFIEYPNLKTQLVFSKLAIYVHVRGKPVIQYKTENCVIARAHKFGEKLCIIILRLDLPGNPDGYWRVVDIENLPEVVRLSTDDIKITGNFQDFSFNHSILQHLSTDAHYESLISYKLWSNLLTEVETPSPSFKESVSITRPIKEAIITEQSFKLTQDRVLFKLAVFKAGSTVVMTLVDTDNHTVTGLQANHFLPDLTPNKKPQSSLALEEDCDLKNLNISWLKSGQADAINQLLILLSCNSYLLVQVTAHKLAKTFNRVHPLRKSVKKIELLISHHKKPEIFLLFNESKKGVLTVLNYRLC